MIERIEWLGHASFRLDGPPLIYIDPWRVARNAFHADVILITHDHYDHFSPADIEKLSGPGTVVISNVRAATLLPEAIVLRPWQVFNYGQACIKAVPAYNAAHPREAEGLGFIISLKSYDVYYAGDTGFIPEMANLRPDIAILPIGGTETMDLEQATEAVRQMRPRYVIPSHWGSLAEGGSVVDARAFARNVESLTEVILPERVR